MFSKMKMARIVLCQIRPVLGTDLAAALQPPAGGTGIGVLAMPSAPCFVTMLYLLTGGKFRQLWFKLYRKQRKNFKAWPNQTLEN